MTSSAVGDLGTIATSLLSAEANAPRSHPALLSLSAESFAKGKGKFLQSTRPAGLSRA